MSIKRIIIKALAAEFEQLQHLTSAGLGLLLRYFDGTCDCKAAAAQIKVVQMS